MRIHLNDRPFACEQPGCGKAFIQRSKFSTFLFPSPRSAQSRLWVCIDRGYSFFKSIYQGLSSTLFDVQALSPSICAYTLAKNLLVSRSKGLNYTHVSLMGTFPLLKHCCAQCGRAFADSSSLARHRRVQFVTFFLVGARILLSITVSSTGARPYLCQSRGCARSFCRKVCWCVVLLHDCNAY